MKYHLYNIRNVSVLITPANTYIQKLKSRINIYKTIRKTNIPILVLCTGKYSVNVIANLYYNAIDKSRLHNMQYISYVSANADTINRDINRFISRIEMQN